VAVSALATSFVSNQGEKKSGGHRKGNYIHFDNNEKGRH
jgi:hypothetical protein